LESLREEGQKLKAIWEGEKKIVERVKNLKEQIEQTKLASESAERRG